MRRPFTVLLVLALALPFAAAFGAGKAPCCCKGAVTCALKAKATCAATCSMGAAHPADSAAIPHGAARQAMPPFALPAPFVAFGTIERMAVANAAARPLPPDTPPPRA